LNSDVSSFFWTEKEDTLNTASMRKLVRVLGMLGSEHAGERAAAALSAHRLVTSHGTTWWALLNQEETPGKVVEVHRVYSYGIDEHAAAEARIRQIRMTCDSLTKENQTLKRRIANMAEQARKARMNGEEQR